MSKWEKFLLCAIILNAAMLARTTGDFQSYLFNVCVVIFLAMFFIFTPGGNKK